MRTLGGIVVLVYLLVGVLIANNHDYFTNLQGVNAIVSAILAVILWPLIIVGVNLHIGGDGNGGKQSSVLMLPAMRAIRDCVEGFRRRHQRTA
jgi:hypothetical protein